MSTERKSVPHPKEPAGAPSVEEAVATEMPMLVPGALPDPVPYGADQTVYVVVDGSPESGGQDRRIEREDFETLVSEFIAGQFLDPQRVLAFNTLEHWSRDVSSDVARQIEARCDIEHMPVPDHVRDFLEMHAAPSSHEAA